jgi:hypothetical protein
VRTGPVRHEAKRDFNHFQNEKSSPYGGDMRVTVWDDAFRNHCFKIPLVELFDTRNFYTYSALPVPEYLAVSPLPSSFMSVQFSVTTTRF